MQIIMPDAVGCFVGAPDLEESSTRKTGQVKKIQKNLKIAFFQNPAAREKVRLFNSGNRRLDGRRFLSCLKEGGGLQYRRGIPWTKCLKNLAGLVLYR
jgi:hypothetical protein